MEVYNRFSFYAKNYRFHPSFKAKRWDGKIYMVNLSFRTIYAGLLQELEEYCELVGYDLIADDPQFVVRERSPAFADDLINSLNLPKTINGRDLIVRDDQKAAIRYSLTHKRGINLMATSSGKSLVIYCILRYLLAKMQGKILILFPNVGLVNQMFADFQVYSSANGWDVAANCWKVYAGVDKKNFNQRVVLSTHQSITALEKEDRLEFLAQFDAVFADEVHLFAAKTTKEILETMIGASYRLGFSGTLEDAQSHQMSLTGLFGPVQQHNTTKELMDLGQIAELTIKSIVLTHKKPPQKPLEGWKGEMGYLTSHEARNRFLANLALSCDGNTLILFNLVEKHAKAFYDHLCQRAEKYGKKVYLMTGDTPAADREGYRKQIDADPDRNNIIVGSFGTVSTGFSLVNLDNMIFGLSPKSKIRNLQSIGRVLRKGSHKTKCQVFDVADDLSFGRKKQNYSIKHYLERYDLYCREGFTVETSAFDL